MKKMLLAVLMLLPMSAKASAYFRIYGWDYQSHSVSLNAISHPKLWAGVLIDPKNLGNSESASLLPLITHSPSDGCFLPSIVCESWSPLAVGGSMNAGKLTFDVAPLWNVMPSFLALAESVAPARLQPLLKQAPSAVTFSAGPVWEFSQATNKGYLKVFTGLALQF